MNNIVPVAPAVKQNKVNKFLRCFLTITYLSLSLTGFTYAATELSDSQMDTVYAEGIFFDFDVSFGTLSDVKSPQTPSSPQAVHSPNINIKTVTPASPSVPKRPQEPAEVAQGKAAAEPQEVSALTVPAAEQNPTVLQIDAAGKGGEGQFHITLQNVPIQELSAPQGQLSPEIPSVTQSPSVPESSFSIEAAEPGMNNLMPFSPGSNTVVVGDQSQQYLSSLVNVNAAGSVVPVLVNIVVNINSKIENMSSVNNVDLSNYYRFQIRS
ncbi:MAG: hypothetical protein WC732_03985 [Candidatus Omnitrophota bacterium]